MAISEPANEAARRTDSARLFDLFSELSALSDVDEAEVLGERTPARCRVVLSVANVTDPVADLLAEYDASIVPDSVEVTGSGGLAFEIHTPEGFRPVGNRSVREYGKASVSVTLTSQSVEASGMDVGTPVDLYAREGAILLAEADE